MLDNNIIDTYTTYKQNLSNLLNLSKFLRILKKIKIKIFYNINIKYLFY